MSALAAVRRRQVKGIWNSSPRHCSNPLFEPGCIRYVSIPRDIWIVGLIVPSRPVSMDLHCEGQSGQAAGESNAADIAVTTVGARLQADMSHTAHGEQEVGEVEASTAATPVC
jgi:hypothetical protein